MLFQMINDLANPDQDIFSLKLPPAEGNYDAKDAQDTKHEAVFSISSAEFSHSRYAPDAMKNFFVTSNVSTVEPIFTSTQPWLDWRKPAA